MKKILFALIVCLCARTSEGAWTLPAGQPGYATAVLGTTVVLGGTTAPSAGDVVVIAALWYGGGASGTTATAQDNNGKTYTQPANSPSTYDAGAGQIFILYRIATGGEGDTVTITFGDTIVVASLWWRFFRPPSAATFDNSAKGTGTGTAINTPTVPVAGSDDLAVVASGYSSGITSANSPWAAGELGSFGEAFTWDLSVSSGQATNFTGDSGGATWTSSGASFTIGGGAAVVPKCTLLGVCP